MQRAHVREPDAPGIFLGLHLGRVDRRSGEFGEGPDFAEHFLGCGLFAVDALQHPVGDAPGELQLGLRPDHGLLHDVGRPGSPHHRIVGSEVRIDEHAVLRHLDIVEDHEGVLLVEAPGQGVIVGVLRLREAVAAEDLHPRRGHRNAERQGVGVRALAQRKRRIDGHFVREGSECRQNTRATDNDARVGLADLMQSDVVARPWCVAQGLIDRRVDDGVGQRQIASAQLLLEGDEVLRAPLVAAHRPFVRPRGETGEGDVHVVRRAAHQPHAVLRPDLKGGVPLEQIVARARDHMAGVDQFTRFRIGDQASVGLRVLQIEHGGEFLGSAAECRMSGDVGDLFVTHIDIAGRLQAIKELSSCSCRHGCPPAANEPS